MWDSENKKDAHFDESCFAFVALALRLFTASNLEAVSTMESGLDAISLLEFEYSAQYLRIIMYED